MRRIVLIAGISVVATLVPAAGAHAAYPCAPVYSAEVKYRMAVSRVGCDAARPVLEQFLTLVSEERYEEAEGSELVGFTCSSGLAMTQVFCEQGQRHVYASSRPNDHPATWGNSHSPLKPKRALSRHEAKGFMREALLRHPNLSFRAGYGRRVVCDHRLTPVRLKCRMQWIVGDIVYFGTGTIWLTFENHAANWNYSYRVTRFNEYCAVVVKADNCTKVFVVR